ncbi:MAG: OmpP1/FadL family transporter, partial [Chthoniobacterales bacterium]
MSFSFSHARALKIALAFLMLPALPLQATGIYNDADARSSALGGEAVAQTGSALSAMDANPAALASLPRAELAVTLTGALLRGEFQQPARSATLRSDRGLIANAALALPAPHQWPVHFGLAVNPDLTLDSSWRYYDQPGGLGGGTSYGQSTQHSSITSVRTTAGVALQATRWLSLGANAGFVYARSALEAPYIFQSQPVLRGFKTLLDLDADGYASTFDFGVQVQPTAKLTLGLSYRPRVVIATNGRATGNAAAQLQALGGGFAAVDPNFSYDAEVRTELPQRVAAGVEWQALDRLRVVAGIDWINWAEAFDQLQIELTNGSNPAINGVAGSSALTDVAPLRWHDQYVYRAGFEFTVIENLFARAGYSYARSPVPNETLTPLPGVIFEHTVSAGVGYRWSRYWADLSWQWRLPATQRVGQSGLFDGEYSRTSLTLSAHLLQL